jgi:hypothetical protein
MLLHPGMKLYNRLVHGRRAATRLELTFLTAVGVITSALVQLVV